MADTPSTEMLREDIAQNAPKDVPSHCQDSSVVRVGGAMHVRGYDFDLSPEW
jgi:hypothetical protein